MERDSNIILRGKSVLIIDQSTGAHFVRLQLEDYYGMDAWRLDEFFESLPEGMVQYNSGIFHVSTRFNENRLEHIEKLILKAHELCPRIAIAQGESVSSEVIKVEESLISRVKYRVDKADFFNSALTTLRRMFLEHP